MTHQPVGGVITPRRLPVIRVAAAARANGQVPTSAAAASVPVAPVPGVQRYALEHEHAQGHVQAEPRPRGGDVRD